MKDAEIDFWEQYRSGAADAFALLKRFEKARASWAGTAMLKYPTLSVDEITTEIDKTLVEVSSKFDPSLNNSFTTFAAPRVKGALIDYIRSMDFLTRGQRQENPDLKQVSIEGSRSDDNDDSEPIEIEYSQVFAGQAENAELWKKIHGTLQRSSNRSAKRHCFVMNVVYREGWSHREVAKFWGCTESYVSYLHSQAIKLLTTSRSLKVYMEGRTWGKTPRVYNKRYSGERFKIINTGFNCATLTCDGKAESRGRCMKCYRAIKVRVNATCSVPGCRKQAYIGCDICSMHRGRMQRHGTTEYTRHKNYKCQCGASAGPSKRCVKCSQKAYYQANKAKAIARAAAWKRAKRAMKNQVRELVTQAA
jgi:RNA polymerase sigma factor (sigma-70 family)